MRCLGNLTSLSPHSYLWTDHPAREGESVGKKEGKNVRMKEGKKEGYFRQAGTLSLSAIMTLVLNSGPPNFLI